MLAVEGGATHIEDGLVFAQVALLILAHKLGGGLIPAITAGSHVGVAGSHEGTGPGALVLVAPEVIVGLAIILHLEYRLDSILLGGVEIVGVITGQFISHRTDFVTHAHHLFILVVAGLVGHVYPYQFGHGGLAGSPAQIGCRVLRLLGQKVDGIFQVRGDEFVNLADRCTLDQQIRLRSLRGDDVGYPAEKTYQNEIVVGSQKVGFAQATVFEALVHIHVGYILQHEVTTQNTGRRATPQIQSGKVVGRSDEIGQIDRLDAIGTTTGSYYTVAGHDVERPDAHVIEFGPLQGLISRIDSSHGIFGGLEPLRRIDRIPRLTIQEITASAQRQGECAENR